MNAGEKKMTFDDIFSPFLLSIPERFFWFICGDVIDYFGESREIFRLEVSLVQAM